MVVAVLMLVGFGLNGGNTSIVRAGDFVSLNICKIAGAGVAAGTNFRFTVNGVSYMVPAVTAVVNPLDCPSTGQIFLPGSTVTVVETIPSGMKVSSISVGMAAVLVSSNLSTGTAVVTVNNFDNVVTFTNVVPVVPPTSGCTFTQGYYKNHPLALPATMKLGTITYTRAQLVTILQTPTRGNGAISLAKQLIAAQANIAKGASAPAAVLAAIAREAAAQRA